MLENKIEEQFMGITKSELCDYLNVLHVLRESMVFDFTSNNYELYISMFKYEQNENLMNLAIDKYYTGWVNSHWDQYISQIDGGQLNSKNISVMVNVMHRLIKESMSTEVHTDLFVYLAKGKLRFYEELLQIGDKDIKRYNELLYQYEKDKAIFERTLREVQQ